MKKRWLALTAALLLCLQGLTACTEEAASDTTTTTTVPITATTAPPVPSGPFHTYLSDEEVATLTASRVETALAVPFCINGTEAVLEKERGVWFFSVKPGEYWEELTPSAEGFEAQYITPFEEDKKINVLKANAALEFAEFKSSVLMGNFPGPLFGSFFGFLDDSVFHCHIDKGYFAAVFFDRFIDEFKNSFCTGNSHNNGVYLVGNISDRLAKAS